MAPLNRFELPLSSHWEEAEQPGQLYLLKSLNRISYRDSNSGALLLRDCVFKSMCKCVDAVLGFADS